MSTLPELSRAWNTSLDVLRAVVRSNPELRAMGQLFGPTRVFSSEEAAKLKAALEERQAKRKAILVSARQK